MTTTTGRPSGGGQPASLADLVQALTELPDLDPIERARRCPELIDAAKAVLAAERRQALLDANTGPDAANQTEIARQLGISRVNVARSIQQAKAEQ